MKPETKIKWIEDRLDKSGIDPSCVFVNGDVCWIWTGFKDPEGYPDRVHWKGKRRKITRIMLEEYSEKEFEDGNESCHVCDNPSCVNPKHLFEATHSENMADQLSKGRRPHGDKHWAKRHPGLVNRGDECYNSKLNETKVRRIFELRRIGLKQWQIADDVGVDQTNVSLVLTGKKWKNIWKEYHDVSEKAGEF